MDLDKIPGQIAALLKFKGEVEAFMAKAQAAGAPSISPDDIGKVLSFLPAFDRALTDFGKLAGDIKSVSEHVAEIRQDLAPVIEWVEAKQREEANAAATAEAVKEANDSAATKEAPAEEKPLAHLAEVEQKLEGADETATG